MFKNKNILIIKHGSTGDIFMSFNIVKSIKKFSSKITICSTQKWPQNIQIIKYSI